MKVKTMSRLPESSATRRLARRTGFLACLFVVANGCAQVSPKRNIAANTQGVSPSNLAAQKMSIAGNVAQTSMSTAGNVNSSSPAATADPNVLPVSYHQTATSVSDASDPNCMPPAGSAAACLAPGVDMPFAPIESGAVPPYWNDQEYLYDGGDREPYVQVTQDWEVRGLDSQDTIAHYETIDGKLCVAATNRVPIYAPRFGAVRKVTAPILAARAVGAERVIEPTGAVVKASRDLANNVAMPVGPRNQDAVKLIDGLRDRTRGVPAEKITPLVNLSNLQVAFQQLQSLGTVVRREDLEAVLGEYMVNARTWTNVDAIAVTIGGVQAVEVRDAKQVQDVHIYETEPGKCSLRICKAASHSVASPGDIINFSIRFDNVGDKPIGNLVILDSLTTRLEYIDGSQQCVLSLSSQESPDNNASPIKFSTAENEAGSTVLRWEADLPLETGDSGVITFRCRVR